MFMVYLMMFLSGLCVSYFMYDGDIDAFRVVYPRCSSPVICQQLDMFSSLGSGCREFLEQRFGIDLSF